MRRFLLLILALVGCGGQRSTMTVYPLTDYGEVEIAASSDFSGVKATAQLSLPPVPLDSGVLSLNAPYDTTPVESDGTSPPARRVEITLNGYDLTVGKRYALSESGSALRLHQKAADGSDLVWISTGGGVLDAGIDFDRRLLKLQNVTIAPVESTGAAGTATLNGSFHIDFADGNGSTRNPVMDGRRLSAP